ncbi:MAG: response regulator transcription factor [Chloroflexi bacterium]|nr:response regulator transcription factor [Chloroflexota bacterium]
MTELNSIDPYKTEILPDLTQDALNQGIDLDLIYGMPTRQRVLIVDDDPDTVELLKEVLRMGGFDVIGALGCGEALKKCTTLAPNLILLDLMMPDIDGWQTFRYLREMTEAPVIIVSAKDRKEDVVKGLQIGVDDYVTKPFFNAEVIARVNTVLRRVKTATTTNQYVFPDAELVINLENQEVAIRNKPVHMTVREFSVLAVLAKQAPRNVSYETIANEVWGEDSENTRKRIKYLIYLLRRKLEKDPSHPTLILNNEAFGYKLNTKHY